MHREFRPQDMHQLDADPFAAASPDTWRPRNRAGFICSRPLLGLLIGGDVLLGIMGLRGLAAAGRVLVEPGCGASGRCVHRLRGTRRSVARPDRGRFRAGAGVRRGAGAGSAVRRRRGRLHCPGRRGARGVTFARTRRAVRSLVDQTRARLGCGAMGSRNSRSPPERSRSATS